MRNFETTKQSKITALISLIKGEIQPNEIPPSFLLKVSPEGNSYFINGRSVDENTFNDKIKNQPAICNFKTVGRVDDDAEFYY